MDLKWHSTYSFSLQLRATQIEKHYWFPNMREKLDEFIKNCLKCIYYSAPPRSNSRNQHSIEKTPLPFHTLHIDHIRPLPALKSKRKHVLLVIDSFTKFVEFYAVNSTNTKEAVYAMKKYFEVYSRLSILVTTSIGSICMFKTFIKDTASDLSFSNNNNNKRNVNNAFVTS